MALTDDAEDKLEDLRSQIAKAQGESNSQKANRLFQKEQELIAELQGNAPVVGSGQRYA